MASNIRITQVEFKTYKHIDFARRTVFTLKFTLVYFGQIKLKFSCCALSRNCPSFCGVILVLSTLSGTPKSESEKVLLRKSNDAKNILAVEIFSKPNF
jgi:hypothetical protein